MPLAKSPIDATANPQPTGFQIFAAARAAIDVAATTGAAFSALFDPNFSAENPPFVATALSNATFC